ncbi:hypothetical protein T10_13334 [Trichinella papuae]|uniref:Uncharacterized protein n=1 Tax=Trichinella papuae TaxID=268474 RepID=A0A0V1N9S7_9BILA|nr:hypothetical protein T10_13334 [Trichinella papuae]
MITLLIFSIFLMSLSLLFNNLESLTKEDVELEKEALSAMVAGLKPFEPSDFMLESNCLNLGSLAEYQLTWSGINSIQPPILRHEYIRLLRKIKRVTRKMSTEESEICREMFDIFVSNLVNNEGKPQ